MADPNAPPIRRPQVTVIGGSQASAELIKTAEDVGRLLGLLGCTVITGGGGGIMEGVSRGAHEQGATTIGILPGEELDGGNPWLDVVIPSGIGFARNMTNVLAADLVVVIGGAAGTLSEIAYAWMHGRPVVALAGTGGWADELAGKRVDDRRTDCVERASSLEELQELVRARLDFAGYRF